MLLTDDERRRFAIYLRQDSQSNRMLAEQLGKKPALKLLYDLKMQEADAEEIVAKMLEQTVTETVTGPDRS